MEGKRLDLDAPLMSLRRITASASPMGDAAPARQRAAPRPYRSDLQSGQVGNSGAVPFVWEKTPGHPKYNYVDGTLPGAAADPNTAAPKLPPGRILTLKVASLIKDASLPPKSDTVRTETPIDCSSDGGTEKAVMEEVQLNPAECCEEEDAFSDARDRLSRTESVSMGCSGTGLSARVGVRDASRNLSKDLQIKEFMMGRFLPAAQAMASGSPRRTRWKPPRTPAAHIKNSEDKTLRRRQLPLHYQCQLSVAPLQANCQKEENEKEEEDCGNYQGMSYFSSKVCGLIPSFCLKSSFCLLNPVPGMKVRDRPPTRPCRTSPRIKVSSLHDNNFEDSWEAVYRHRLRLANSVQKENGSKSTSESNQLTNWSDSQTLDDSSSFLYSSGASQSPNKSDVKTKSMISKSGSFDSCEEDSMFSNGKLQGSSSTSPAIDRTLFVHSSHLPDTLNSNSSLVDMTAGTKETMDSSENGCTLISGFQRTEESVVTEISEGFPLQSKFGTVADSGSPSCSRRLNCEKIKGNNFISGQNEVLELKVDVKEKNDYSLVLSLLPPPLPKSPSDSWLQRTLPSISAKGSYQQSLLGIQFHPRNKTLQASRGDHKLVAQEKSSKMHPRWTRFAGGPNPPCESVKSLSQSSNP